MKKYGRAYVEITRRCNRRCDFCPSGVEGATAGEMSVEFFSSVAAEVAGVAEEIYLHVLGEPLLHGGLGEVLAVCRRVGLPVNVTTNGDLAWKRRKELLDRAVRQVNFSMHAHGDGEGIGGILEFIREALAERPDLYLNLRFWNGDADNGALLRRIGDGLGMEIPELPAGRSSVKLGGRVYLNFDRRFAWPVAGEPGDAAPGRCLGLVDQFAVLHDGRVTICCLDASGAETLGKIGEAPLAEILDSPKARAIRDGWRRNQAVAGLCRDCSYRDRFRAYP